MIIYIIYSTKLGTRKRRNVNETEMKPCEKNENEIKFSVIKLYQPFDYSRRMLH